MFWMAKLCTFITICHSGQVSGPSLFANPFHKSTTLNHGIIVLGGSHTISDYNDALSKEPEPLKLPNCCVYKITLMAQLGQLRLTNID